ncbi:protein disulfide-isomerase c17h9.14c [Anaeramoeba flamelloides]|uniref:Protein disulfide-isomerase c17h9.14c n=1 Tax=Anaeramoeba flamelloides TaxID=1746091 RepID=A0ABQ8Y5Q1_9EUKA|nr:protein disulfide-isomerase c17h9.14c [Anaeramoeba flamelloides]
MLFQTKTKSNFLLSTILILVFCFQTITTNFEEGAYEKENKVVDANLIKTISNTNTQPLVLGFFSQNCKDPSVNQKLLLNLQKKYNEASSAQGKFNLQDFSHDLQLIAQHFLPPSDREIPFQNIASIFQQFMIDTMNRFTRQSSQNCKDDGNCNNAEKPSSLIKNLIEHYLERCLILEGSFSKIENTEGLKDLVLVKRFVCDLNNEQQDLCKKFQIKTYPTLLCITFDNSVPSENIFEGAFVPQEILNFIHNCSKASSQNMNSHHHTNANNENSSSVSLDKNNFQLLFDQYKLQILILLLLFAIPLWLLFNKKIKKKEKKLQSNQTKKEEKKLK